MEKLLWLDGHVTAISAEEAYLKSHVELTDDGYVHVLRHNGFEFEWHNNMRYKTIDIILISITISIMSIFSLIKQGIVMEKVLKTLLNIVLYTIVTVFLGLFSFAFLLGLAEGDLSHGLFCYLQ